jgi:hypothetical protein
MKFSIIAVDAGTHVRESTWRSYPAVKYVSRR